MSQRGAPDRDASCSAHMPMRPADKCLSVQVEETGFGVKKGKK